MNLIENTSKSIENKEIMSPVIGLPYFSSDLISEQMSFFLLNPLLPGFSVHAVINLSKLSDDSTNINFFSPKIPILDLRLTGAILCF